MTEPERLVERLAAKYKAESGTAPYVGDVQTDARWWLNAIAGELEAEDMLTDDAGRRVAWWLREQASK